MTESWKKSRAEQEMQEADKKRIKKIAEEKASKEKSKKDK